MYELSSGLVGCFAAPPLDCYSKAIIKYLQQYLNVVKAIYLVCTSNL